LEADSANQGIVNSTGGTSTTWTKLSIVYSSNNFSPESFKIFIGLFGTTGVVDTSSYVLLDNFKVEEY
jgi:hypothetical protein